MHASAESKLAESNVADPPALAASAARAPSAVYWCWLALPHVVVDAALAASPWWPSLDPSDTFAPYLLLLIVAHAQATLLGAACGSAPRGAGFVPLAAGLVWLTFVVSAPLTLLAANQFAWCSAAGAAVWGPLAASYWTFAEARRRGRALCRGAGAVDPTKDAPTNQPATNQPATNQPATNQPATSQRRFTFSLWELGVALTVVAALLALAGWFEAIEWRLAKGLLAALFCALGAGMGLFQSAIVYAVMAPPSRPGDWSPSAGFGLGLAILLIAWTASIEMSPLDGYVAPIGAIVVWIAQLPILLLTLWPLRARGYRLGRPAPPKDGAGTNLA